MFVVYLRMGKACHHFIFPTFCGAVAYLRRAVACGAHNGFVTHTH